MGIEDRGKHLGDRLLYDTIHDRGYAQWAGSPTIFRNLHPLHRGGRIGPLQKCGINSFPVPAGIFRKLLNRYIINTGSPFVCPDLFVRLMQVISFEHLKPR